VESQSVAAPLGQESDPDLETTALRKVRNRLIPFLGLLYFAAFIDRVNISFAVDGKSAFGTSRPPR
jgi:hypothetical protein